MVSLTDVQASNNKISSVLPPGLVAVFVGATSGIGEYTLKQFAKYAKQPRVYFIGRSQEAGDRIADECKALNAEGEFHFIKADTSLIKNVDNVCRDIKTKEKVINLLFLSTGTLVAGIETSEKLHFAASLILHSRARFVANLLPLLRASPSLKRVVSVFAAGKEGAVHTGDFQGRTLPLMQQRGHAASLVTFSHEALARQAPDVSFVHDFPGSVKSGIGRGTTGAMMFVLKAVFKLLGPLVNMPEEECGERHLFFATSARFPAGVSVEPTAGVPLAEGVQVARGTDAKVGSGCYSIDQYGESAGPKVEELLAAMREEGMVEKVWAHTEGEFERITGEKAV